MVIGGWIDSKRSAQTEMMTLSSRNWKSVTTAFLPVPLVNSAALTINNQVYLFGNFLLELTAEYNTRGPRLTIKHYDRLTCTERINSKPLIDPFPAWKHPSYAIKTQRKARNAPSKCFGCLELFLKA